MKTGALWAIAGACYLGLAFNCKSNVNFLICYGYFFMCAIKAGWES